MRLETPLHVLLLRVALTTVLAVAVLPVGAQEFPSKNISLVVPYAPGGPSDSAARILRPVFEKVLGKTTIVENIAGAGGSLGAQKVLREPDGHQILIGSPNEVLLAPLGMAAVKYKAEDFRLVGTVGELPYVLVGRPGLAFNTIDELIAHSRNKANTPLTYGSVGTGSLNHLAGEAFRAQTGVHLTHVPYKGGAPLVQDLLSSVIDIAFTPLSGNVPGLIETGKLKMYGVTTTTRSAKLQHLPTVNEGKVLKNFAYSIWVGPIVAKSTPEAAVARISAALSEALKQPDVRKSLDDAGFVGTTVLVPTEANQMYLSEAANFKKIAQSIDLQAQ